jgi:competence protein ComEC
MLRHFPPARIFFIFNVLFCLVIFLIGARPQAFAPRHQSSDLAQHNGQKVNFIGRVCEEAEVDYKSRKLTLCASGRVLVTTSLYPAYEYGDFLEISGQLQTPEKINGFDYDRYLARHDIYSLMYYPKISVRVGNLSASQRAYQYLLRFKWQIREAINSSLPEPEAGLANALLLGYRKTVRRADLEMFSRVGLSHMIAISGSHITIMSAMFINFLLALGMGRRRSLSLIFIFLFIYPVMTGLSASAVRSAIMGALAFGAVYYGRPVSLIYPLTFSGALMLAFNPRLLRDDIGFQLSFLAVLGIIYLYPLVEAIYVGHLEKLKARRRPYKFLKTILDTINLTLVSQFMILPIAAINFQQVSLIAPLANILVLWTFPWLLAVLIIAAALFLVFPFLGVLLFFPPLMLLKYIFFSSEFLAQFSWAAAEVTDFNWHQGALYYAVLWLLVVIWRRILKNRPVLSGRFS